MGVESSVLAMILSVALAAASPEQAIAPRQVAEDVARAIEENYFDAAEAARIAGSLRDEARGGGFDGLAPQQLANRLTARLRPHDGHFRVSYAPAPAPRADGGDGPRYGPEEQDRRSGYGFREVAVLPGNVGYIDLRSFAPIDFSDPAWPARRSADGALALLARTDALIVDLRANGGGDPSMVGYLVSAFVEPGRDVYNVFHARERRQSERPEIPYPGARLAMPVHVLISGRTGSAAEAFAYTLQAARRATVVGEASADAANPGGEIPLGSGWRVFVSGATPINPLTNGNWEGSGVVPDLPVPAGEALARARVAALEAALPNLPEAERADAELTLEALRSAATAIAGADGAAYAGTYETAAVTAAEQGHLVLRIGRRPGIALAPLSRDIFYPVDSPSTRYRFRRGGAGEIEALEVHRVDGSRSEYRRGPEQG